MQGFPLDQEPHFEAGLDVRAMLVRLVRDLRDVASLTVLQFRPALSLSEVPDAESERRHLLLASPDGARRKVWLPRHLVLFAEQLAEAPISMPFLGRAVRHDEQQRDTIRTVVSREEFSMSRLEAIQGDRPDWALAISSRVTLVSGEGRHLPMMDFQCPISGAYLSSVIAGLRAIGQGSGVIVKSGRSYHYYGLDLFSQAQWHKFMCKCLLLTPLADERYIGHRLLDNECVLRIASMPQKGMQPAVEQLFS